MSSSSSWYPSEWSEWEWSSEYNCQTRYRLISEREYEWDYRTEQQVTPTEYTPRNPEANPPPLGTIQESFDDGTANISAGLANTSLNTTTPTQGWKGKGKAAATYSTMKTPASYPPTGYSAPMASSNPPTKITDQNSNTKQEALDPRFKVHKSKEFEFGRVFKVLWSEPSGSGGTEITGTERAPAKYDQKAYHKIRRFLIVDNRRGHCICLPILTYGGQGTLKFGAHPEDHAVVYSSKSKGPCLLKHEKIKRKSIRCEIPNPSDKLDPASRLNYAKLYTVEHNVKVLFIGRVAPSHEQQVVVDYNDAHPSLEDRPYTGRKSEDLARNAEGADPEYTATPMPQAKEQSIWTPVAGHAGPVVRSTEYSAPVMSNLYDSRFYEEK